MLLGLVRPTAGTATIGGGAYAGIEEPTRVVGAVLEASAVGLEGPVALFNTDSAGQTDRRWPWHSMDSRDSGQSPAAMGRVADRNFAVICFSGGDAPRSNPWVPVPRLRSSMTSTAARRTCAPFRSPWTASTSRSIFRRPTSTS